MPINVPMANATEREAQIAALRFVVDSAETVDSYCTDFLNVGVTFGLVDLDALEIQRVDTISRALRELDAIASSTTEHLLIDAASMALAAETSDRARALAAAIREALAVMCGSDQ